MSKVIKACFVKNSETLNKTNNPNEDNEFTKKTANEIYLETKKMVNDLLCEAQNQAETIIRTAEKKAGELIQEKQRECEISKKKAYEEGLNSGHQAGMEKAEEEIKKLGEEIVAFAQNMINNKEKFLQGNTEQITDLVLIICQKIINSVVALKPEIIAEIVKNVLTEVSETEKTVIKVNPIHLPYLNIYSELFKDVDSSKISIEVDSELKPGDCILTSDSGVVEARIEDQLLLLQKTLKEESNNVGL